MMRIVALRLLFRPMNMPQEQFRITIDAFDGPLDLLLYLVRRAEVDIHDIRISQITEEYLQVLRDGVSVDVEMAGEFLVMAATLIEIKSRSLVPTKSMIQTILPLIQEETLFASSWHSNVFALLLKNLKQRELDLHSGLIVL
jgi:chromatin segregation and condensation protein Rec8/ScpA/Scc1 (kleisin family)